MIILKEMQGHIYHVLFVCHCMERIEHSQQTRSKKEESAEVWFFNKKLPLVAPFLPMDFRVKRRSGVKHWSLVLLMSSNEVWPKYLWTIYIYMCVFLYVQNKYREFNFMYIKGSFTRISYPIC